ncbi:MAG: SusC/RagA family TonB-linked outer membrane protein [Flavisolibacter sp.]
MAIEKMLRRLLPVFISLLSATAIHAQNIMVSGRILDQNRSPLQGVSVQVKGSNAATSTLADGSFQIAVPSEKSSLVISHIGFEQQEIPVGSQREISLSLKPVANAMENVVVIGYGTQKKKNVTGAVSSYDARKLEERPVQRVDQALVGQMAGVTVRQTTGIPGKGFSVQIRGTGSISGGNEPLYVIDGFPLSVNSSNTSNGSFSTGNPLDNINPNDIESIEVLKDAAAAAIYGSRASNGVVLITTKRGQSGKPKLNFNMYAGYNAASKKLTMLNGDQWIERATEMINAAYVLKYGSVGATANDDAATRRAKIGLTGTQINTTYMLDPRWAMPGHPGLAYHDWQDEIERKGWGQNYELSASGGNDAVRYFISGNYSNQDGFIVGVNYKTYSTRANVELNASKKLKFGLNIAPSYSVTQDPGVEGKDNIFHQALSMTPVQEDTVGQYPNIGKNATYFWSNSTNGSLGKLQNNVGTTKRYRTIGTIFGELQIIPGLNLRSSLNLDNTDNISTTYVPYITTGSQGSRAFTGSNNLLAATSGTYNSFRRQTFVNENTLNYSTEIKNIHSINVLAGWSYNAERLDRAQLNSSGGFTNGVIQTLNAAAAVTGNTTSTRNILTSIFGRVQYAFRDKYLLSASLRRDGSSRFGENKKYGVFPSASIGWRMIEENFAKNISFLSDLKLRLSYGENGNNNLPNDYASIATIGSAGYVFGTAQTAAIGQAPNVLANPNLHWERSKTYDAGFDFGILRNRITGSFDYYNKLNTDLLLFVQVPEVTGFQTYLTNIGAVRNIGQELEITSRNLVHAFQWNTSVNISHNSNKVEALAPGQSQIIIPNGLDVTDQILRVGQALNSIYVVKQIGFLTQEDINKHVAVYNSVETVGDPKYEDLNGDGVITEADKQIVGHPNPNFTYGITNTFHYKGFDLDILVQGQTGGSIYSLLGRAITRTGQGFTDNAPEAYTQRWRSPDNPGAGRFSKAYSTFGFIANTDWLYSSDYIRVRTISLGYNLKTVVKTSAVQGARIYFTLENFFGHDKYTNGLNPEAANTTISSNSAYPEAGDYGGLPLPKSMVLGITISF